MDKKYILTDITKEVDGHTLHRIQAVRDFQKIHNGDLGGWVESEDNLSQDGDCWIFDDAMVWEYGRAAGNAVVMDHAVVSDVAYVTGDVLIADNAVVNDHACISEHARIFGNAIVTAFTDVRGSTKIGYDAFIHFNSFGCIGGLRSGKFKRNADICKPTDYIVIEPLGSRNDFTTFYHSKDDDIWVSCGCFNNSLKEFESAVRTTHAHNDLHKSSYLRAIEFAWMQIRY